MNITREWLLEIGFKGLSHKTIGSTLIYKLPFNKRIHASDIATPNEMIWIVGYDSCDERKVTDIISFRNFDYHGYATKTDVANLISLLSLKK